MTFMLKSVCNSLPACQGELSRRVAAAAPRSRRGQSKRACTDRARMADSARHGIGMSARRRVLRDQQAARRARRLMDSVRAVLAARPEADPDNVRHTLILLELPPLERLRRSLTRGRALAQRK